ncbi:hypothetical protein [Ideonella sp. A 288]|uniref:hypothetical protein n=1 Tax=Ideonella sp. A 288 TaxID=1962181 RepID=UPI000B4AF36B|nr:hypothetical protein [Ideonella sp. A 288]
MPAPLRLLPIAALGLAMVAWAGPLADPTRPPTIAVPASTAAPAGPRPAAAAAAAARAPVAPVVAPVLQSLQVSARGPSSAMVDGQVVQVGDRIGERLVLAIDHDGLLLRAATGQGTERLTLLPGGTKQAAGSISINRVAGYAPAASAAAEAAQAAPSADAASAPTRDRPADDTARSPQPSPLSLAGRSKP